MARRKRKHAKPDAFERFAAGFFNRLGRSWRAVAAGAVFLLVVVAAGLLLSGRNRRRDEAGHARLEEALAAEKDRGSALLAVADEFAGSAPGAEALLRAARELREEATGALVLEKDRKRALELAEDALRRFLATGPGDDLAVLAREQLAFTLEDGGRLAESAALLRETLVEYPDSLLRAKLNYDLGRAEFALGPDHHADARSHLQLALDASALQPSRESSWQQAARFLLAGLELPEEPKQPVEAEVAIPSEEEGEGASEETEEAPDGETEDAAAEADETDAAEPED